MWLDLAKAVKHWGKYFPMKNALITDQGTVTFQELDSAADNLAVRLQRYGVLAGSRTGIVVATRAEFLASIVACKRIGSSVAILNVGLQLENLALTITDSKPDTFIVGDSLRNVQMSLGLDPCVYVDSTIWQSDKCNPEVFSEPSNTILAQEWGILFSSGSTGTPKAVVLDGLSITSELLAWCLELELRRTSKFFIGRPLNYTGGLVLAASCLLVGATIICPSTQQVDDDCLWHLYQQMCGNHTIDWAFFIPSELRSFVSRIAKGDILNKGGAENILTMGEPISGKEKRLAHDYLGSTIIESWGNSEGLGTITDADDLKVRPDSSGRPFLTEEILILDEKFHVCQPGITGRVAGRQDTMFTEYANRNEATERTKRDNYILSDDLGYLDEDGYLYVTGRSEDVIIAEGETLVIPILEERLRATNWCNDAAIVSITVDNKPTLAIFVILKDTSLEGAELHDQCVEFLDVQIQITKVKSLDKIPRLPSGKIDKPKLMEFANG